MTPPPHRSPEDLLSELTDAFGVEHEQSLATSIRITEEFLAFLQPTEQPTLDSAAEEAYALETIQSGVDSFFVIRSLIKVITPSPSVSRRWLSPRDTTALSNHFLMIHSSMLEPDKTTAQRVDCLGELIRCQLLYMAERFCA